MQRRRPESLPDLYSDPFGERAGPLPHRECMEILGCVVNFESNSRELMRLVRLAYAGLPSAGGAGPMPELTVRLLLSDKNGSHRRSEPPPLTMTAAPGILAAATTQSSFVALSPAQRTALVVMAPQMLRFPYHARYELIEFSVFTLASRVRQLVPLHGACVGVDGRGILLMGASGSGKSTVSVLSLLSGFQFLAEDSVFVEPGSLLATGVANFVHVRASSLAWMTSKEAAAIRKAPVISRRSGVRKFEVDVRKSRYRKPVAALRIRALVFLSAAAASGTSLLKPLSTAQMLDRLAAEQAYAAGRSGWDEFCAGLAGTRVFELRRGQHPSQAVAALRDCLGHPD
jgi:hypothetical protein